MNVPQIATKHNMDAQIDDTVAVDRPPPINNFSCNNEIDFDDNQLDLLKSFEYDNATNLCVKELTPSIVAQQTDATETATTNKNKINDFNGENEVDDYNDDSVSDISDLSDVFKLNADILPEMQRSIDWVSRFIRIFANFIFYSF